MAGVISRGIQGPIIREGDDIVDIVVKSVYASEQADGYTLQNRDVIAVTESVVARAQGNGSVTVDQVAQDIRAKFPAKKLGLVFPILSRYRFSMCLKAIARAMDAVVVLFSYPNDEVGNPLTVRSAYLKNRYSGVYDFEEADFVQDLRLPRPPLHRGELSGLLPGSRSRARAPRPPSLSCNDCRYIASYCDGVYLCCDIHTRNETRDVLQSMGKQVLTLADIMNAPVDGSGYHEAYGMLGSNKANEEKLEALPPELPAGGQRACRPGSRQSAAWTWRSWSTATAPPQGPRRGHPGAWLTPWSPSADTAGLAGKPNELKLKFLADNDFADLSGEALQEAIRQEIRAASGRTWWGT